MATFDTPDYIIGNSATIQAQLAGVLTTLDQALQALEPAPNATTVQFNNTILLQDPLVPTETATMTAQQITMDDNAGISCGLNNSSLSFDNTNTGDFSTLNATTLSFNSGGITPNIISNTGGTQLTVQASNGMLLETITGDILMLNTSNDSSIRLYAPNINAYQNAMPICFTRPRADTFTYTFGGQNFENVYTTNCQIPQEYISLNPLAGYTSTIWKIEFALNCYQFSNPTDKGMGLYIEFNDSASNLYTPFVYNSLTPYSADQKTFGYNGGANAPYINFNWTDYVDLAGLVNTATANFPLEVKLYFAADSALSTQFNLLVTLTRTNSV